MRAHATDKLDHNFVLTLYYITFGEFVLSKMYKFLVYRTRTKQWQEKQTETRAFIYRRRTAWKSLRIFRDRANERSREGTP